MNNFTFTHNGITYKRINKTAAKKAYVNGSEIVLCPHKLCPFGYLYNSGITVSFKQSAELDPLFEDYGIEKGFDVTVNAFEFYNCGDNEVGKYAAYYIKA